MLGVTAQGDILKIEEKVRENQREKTTNFDDLIKSQRDILFIDKSKGKRQGILAKYRHLTKSGVE